MQACRRFFDYVIKLMSITCGIKRNDYLANLEGTWKVTDIQINRQSRLERLGVTTKEVLHTYSPLHIFRYSPFVELASGIFNNQTLYGYSFIFINHSANFSGLL